VREIAVVPVALDRLGTLLPPERAERLASSAARARSELGDRTVWHVNSTASGGGVAELLHTLLAYGNGAGVVNRWLVLDADRDFFTITKRLHNLLHGQPGDGGPLAGAEREHYRAVLADNAATLKARVSPRDIVVLHDPQTAGLVRDARTYSRVVWRCHVGRDTRNESTDIGWEFLRDFIADADAFVFSRAAYAPEWLDPARVWVIPPSIDPFSAKNVGLAPAVARSMLARAGILDHALEGDSAGRGVQRDGAEGLPSGRLGTEAASLIGAPLSAGDRFVLQVSRWDTLKDMAGVMTAFGLLVGEGLDDVHLVLAGPQTSGVSDDPEQAQVLAECERLWHELPARTRDRIHLATLPMRDVQENALIVNALQRLAAVVVQKSLVEGFGLTVTEAMWKGRPVVASRVGGIQDQITHGVDGLLIDDPYDLPALAETLRTVLVDAPMGERLGRAARARVMDEYVGDRHLERYADLLVTLVAERDQ